MKVFVERLPLGVEENEREEPDPPLCFYLNFLRQNSGRIYCKRNKQASVKTAPRSFILLKNISLWHTSAFLTIYQLISTSRDSNVSYFSHFSPTIQHVRKCARPRNSRCGQVARPRGEAMERAHSSIRPPYLKSLVL